MIHSPNRIFFNVLCLMLACPIPLLAIQAENDAETPPANPARAPATVDEALDRALDQIRIAESSTPESENAFKQARQLLQLVAETEPLNRRMRYYNSRLMILANRRDEAIHIVEEWTKSPEGKNDWEGLYILGTLYAEGTYYQLAKPMLDRAVALNPREPRIYVQLARCAMRLAKPEVAVRHAKKAVELLANEVTPSHYLLLADALLKQGDLQEAQRVTRLATERASAMHRNDRSQIEVLKTLDQCYQMALKTAQAGLQAQPSATELYLDMAELIQRRADVARTLADYEALDIAAQGLKAGGDHPPESLILYTIRLFQKLGINDQALQLAKQMVELYPSNADGQLLLRRLESSGQSDPG